MHSYLVQALCLYLYFTVPTSKFLRFLACLKHLNILLLGLKCVLPTYYTSPYTYTYIWNYLTLRQPIFFSWIIVPWLGNFKSMIYDVIDPNYFVLACPSDRSAGSNSGVNLKFYEKGWGIAMYKRSDTSTKRVCT